MLENVVLTDLRKESPLVHELAGQMYPLNTRSCFITYSGFFGLGPQGLKPLFDWVLNGTAKAVPFQS